MPRYARRLPRAGGWVPVIEPDDHHALAEGLLPDLSVPEPSEPRATGLYDIDGNELFRLPEPLGFHHPKD